MAVVQTNIADHIAVVTLNRAEARNALNPELIVGLAATWRSLAADDDASTEQQHSITQSTFTRRKGECER